MNPQELTIQVLVENTSNRKGWLGEHGLSYLITSRDRFLLFDTGQGLALAHNATALGVDLEKIDSIILSHGHYDHTGGLCFFSQSKTGPTIYAHPNAWQKKYAKKQQNQYYSVGIPDGLDVSLREKVIGTEQPTQIIDGIWVTGEVPRENEWEQSTGTFYLDDRGQQTDELKDDQSIFIKTNQGIVVLLGCAHSGVVNTLQYIERLTGGMGIGFVMGGMHLLNASLERINQTIQELRRMNVKKIAPCHCTGVGACHTLRSSFGDQYVECSVGTEFRFIRE